MRSRFIVRIDGQKWRIWDRDQAKWRGKAKDYYSDISAELRRLNAKEQEKHARRTGKG
jgi:hypothetical protein